MFQSPTSFCYQFIYIFFLFSAFITLSMVSAHLKTCLPHHSSPLVTHIFTFPYLFRLPRPCTKHSSQYFVSRPLEIVLQCLFLTDIDQWTFRLNINCTNSISLEELAKIMIIVVLISSGHCYAFAHTHREMQTHYLVWHLKAKNRFQT